RAVIGMSTAAVKPSIGTKLQPVRDGVVQAGNIESIQHDFRLTVWNAISIAIRNEEELGDGDDPNSSVTHGHAHHALQFVGEYFPGAEPTLAVAAFEHQDPVAQARIKAVGLALLQGLGKC